MFQGFGYRGPDKYRDMLLATATEEIGHVEVLATAVAMNLEGAPGEKVDDVVTNPAVAARMGALEPRHFLSAGLGAMPADANGVPFTTASVDTGGNLIADMRANVAAEAIGRTLAARLFELTDDPGMKDLLRFLIARDTMHQQQWLAVLEELGPDEMTMNAPGDFPNEGEFKEIGYTFFDHTADAPPPPDARWAMGPSMDGQGTFRAEKPPVAGKPVELAKAPPETHSGAEATGPPGSTVAGRFTRMATDLADKVTPGS